MERICLEWNINCKNDAKNNHRDEHELRSAHFELENGKFESVHECEDCDYSYIEINDVPNIIQWELSEITYEEIKKGINK